MPSGRIRTLFVDTSSLRRAGFQSPDLRKLLVRCGEQSVRVVVSHIAWEEWRTQLLEKSSEKVRNVKAAFEALTRALPSNFILGRLPPPALAIWDDADIDAASKAAMDGFAKEYRIEVIPIGSDHGERAWRRYFKAEPPFNAAVRDREKRRKDIPDSWIYEAALDLVTEDRDVAALCHDENLSQALESLGMRVFREPEHLADEFDRLLAPVPPVAAEHHPATPAEPLVQSSTPLAMALGQALTAFPDYERKVVGFIAHFGSPSKDELFGLLSRSGVPREIGQNVAERLALAGVVQDTGHHYLVPDKRLAQLAVESVEDDIIKLLAGESPNGL